MTGEPRIPDKGALRTALLAQRRALDPQQKAMWDAVLNARVLDWAQQAGVVQLGVYWPLRGEPDLQPAYAELARRGVLLVLPVVVARDAALGFAAWTPGEAMIKDSMGVAVPEALRPVPAPPALLVPCLGYNTGRYRLGYGGGYYDRTLAGPDRPFTVGIAYAATLAPFDGASHDVALDLILNEA